MERKEIEEITSPTAEEGPEEVYEETEGAELVRQRVTTARSVAATNEVQPQRATMNSNEGFRNLIIWFLIAAIAFLVYRRLFLL